MEHAQSLKVCERESIFVLFTPTPCQQRRHRNGKEMHHDTVRYRTREMNRLHFLRKSANDRIDGGASKTRNVHAQYKQARARAPTDRCPDRVDAGEDAWTRA
jgi:hypothetical protein